MKIIAKFEQFHLQARQNIWIGYFAIFCRIALAAGFLPSGFVKINGERFTALANNHPMGHYLEALFFYILGVSWNTHVFHSSFINGIITLATFFVLRSFKFNKYIRVWKLYKPIKVICSNRDLQKRTTIFDILPKNIPRVISVGRLDFYSEGLIILTNNGDLARNLELPSSNILRVYHLCILGNIEKKMIQKINHGVSINKIFYKKISVQIQKKQKDCTWLLFKLREGKNREIRNICNFFNWKILKLIRVQYGSIKLSGLEPGKVKEVKNYINKPC